MRIVWCVSLLLCLCEVRGGQRFSQYDRNIENKDLDFVNCNSTGPACSNDCTGLDDDYHQFCGNCSTFLACQSGSTLYAECPGNWVFDNNFKRCAPESTSCDECYVSPRCNSTGPTCISSCMGQNDGFYQSCSNCTSYIVCIGGVLRVEHCTAGLEWDDVNKGCSITSRTCFECFDWNFCESTGPNCYRQCLGLPDGLYQSCDNCHEYIQCNAGAMTKQFCSPVGYWWDDNNRGCFLQPTVLCQHCAVPDLCDGTGTGCIKECRGMQDGFYQACGNCSSYVKCESMATYYGHCQDPTWEWDDSFKACLPFSTTCTCGCQTGPSCIKGCMNVPSGYYQLCDTCTSYGACVHGVLERMDCPALHTWHDDIKSCDMAPSLTCTDC